MSFTCASSGDPTHGYGEEEEEEEGVVVVAAG